VSWVPPALLDVAQMGIYVNPVQVSECYGDISPVDKLTLDFRCRAEAPAKELPVPRTVMRNRILNTRSVAL